MSTLHADAMAALNAMRRGDHTATDHALNQLATRHGPKGITNALVIWCDAALNHLPSSDGPVTLTWKDHATGHTTRNPARIRPAEQWAGRILAARAAGDLDMFTALANAVPARAVPEHVGAMVQMAARIIQGGRA
jgi:hypothetical protein